MVNPLPNRPPPPPLRKRLLLWGLGLLLLLATAWWLFLSTLPGSFYEHFDKCAEGVAEADGECVGVTDGAYVFDAYLEDITRLIHAENRNVEKSGKPWVSVAYLQPMTLAAGDKGRGSVRQELEGAHLAQHALNRHAEGGRGEEPQIKLLLANPGTGAEHWEPLTRDLIAMKGDDEHRLVGVAGFGQSLETTKKAIDRLRDAGLPLIGSTITADDFTSEAEPGFFRVVPPNKDQASAIAKHLRREQDKESGRRVAVIRDRNPDDLYATSLHEGFTRAAGAQGLRLRELGLAYDSSEPGTRGAFSAIADKVCQDRTQALYFAGRGRQLREFVEAMAAAGRRCAVTVYTGDDADSLDDADWSAEDRERFAERWRESRTTVRFTALAHPGLWAEGYPGGKDDPFPDFQKRYHKLTGRGADQLSNGQGITGHDALFTMGVAIRTAGRDRVEAGAVRQMMLQISGTNAVPGVSGPIRFLPRGDPQDKPLPLVEMRPSGEYTFLEVVRP
ncbi:ABC transporter substrate-binding protein [Streptomyces sp. NPDC088745]|uniref:ABC transporter substrate-binding protein n=1 Tax=Streptomyces sp. NPDC088745 TaxID=3365884 RepID=UPI003819D322